MTNEQKKKKKRNKEMKNRLLLREVFLIKTVK